MDAGSHLPRPLRRGLRWALALVGAWLLFVAAPSVRPIRAILGAPLVVDDREARGDAAYVLASGSAMHERLRAAADLWHMGRVPRLLLVEHGGWSYFNFVEQESWSYTRWQVAWLRWRGVPESAITVLPAPAGGALGTRGEARAVGDWRPVELQRLVIVSSPAHMRRSVLAFERALPEGVSVVPFAATELGDSSELWRPLWLEYAKLVLYWIVA